MSSRLRAWLIAPVVALGGALSGALYGLVSYTIFRAFSSIMLPSFIFFVPFVMGVIAALLSRKLLGTRGYLQALAAIGLVMLVTLIFSFESALCWLILLPIALIAAYLGVFLVNLIHKRHAAKVNLLFSFMLLPSLMLSLEGFIPPQTIYQSTHNSIIIKAPPDVIWQAIKSVPTISQDEYSSSWTQRFGLPRPLAATLSYEGVGGVREATFSSGLSFLEEVTDWQPNKTLAFSIVAQGNSQERTAFALGPDIGGEFVDVKSGRYTLEALDEDHVLLHLYSTQRLSSKLNSYAGFWVHAVMRDLQGTILQVIKKRCEEQLER